MGKQRMYLLRNLLLGDFHNSLRWCVFPLQSRLLKYVRSRQERNGDVLGPGGEARNNSRTPPPLRICPRISTFPNPLCAVKPGKSRPQTLLFGTWGCNVRKRDKVEMVGVQRKLQQLERLSFHIVTPRESKALRRGEAED